MWKEQEKLACLSLLSNAPNKAAGSCFFSAQVGGVSACLKQGPTYSSLRGWQVGKAELLGLVGWDRKDSLAANAPPISLSRPSQR